MSEILTSLDLGAQLLATQPKVRNAVLRGVSNEALAGEAQQLRGPPARQPILRVEPENNQLARRLFGRSLQLVE